MKNSDEQIFFFLCHCHDNGFIPDIDTLSDKFPETDWDVLKHEVKSFVNIHEMEGIEVLWEGDLQLPQYE
ncbi:hypothetical protein ABEY41_28120 [Peribacillus butanolivorans]|uniref:hypothetical protein n=1 Tax=Peribacillus butanolivorans TaxID=421767 RepID=UPI00365F6274